MTKKNSLQGLDRLYSINLDNGWIIDNYTSLFFERLWQVEQSNDKDGFKSLVANLYDIEEPYIFFAIAPLLLAKYGELVSSVILDKSRQFYKSYDKGMINTDLKNSLKTIQALGFVMQDEYILTTLKNCGNRNLYNLWTMLGQKKISDVDCARASQSLQASYVESVSPEMALDFMMEDALSSDFSNGVVRENKYQSLDHKRVILEFMIESSMLFGDENSDKAVDHYMQELCDTEAEMLALEWEADGEPNAVIKEHIMTTRGEKERRKEEICRR